MIGLCIGHSRRGDSGAWTVGPNSESEYKFNTDLVRRVAPLLNVEYKIYDDYHASSYVGAMNYVARKLKEDEATSCVEFHFNAASPRATGHEWLYWYSSSGGRRLAEDLKIAMEEVYPELATRGARKRIKGDRGALFLRTTPCYAVIGEPFFGSNINDVDLINEDRDMLAKAYANGINNFYGRG